MDELERKVVTDSSPASRAELAVGLFLIGKKDYGIRILEALSANSSEPAFESSLAAMYLARADATGHQLDLLQALRHARRAFLQGPTSAEVLFNRASVFTALHLRRQAITAWNAYLETTEEDDGWVREARHNMDVLSRSLTAEQWNEQREWLEEDSTVPDEKQIDKLVSQFPYRSRMYAQDELMMRWALDAETQRASKAERSLAIAHLIADSLAHLNGDRFLSDAIATVEKCQNNERLDRQLKRGHRLYGEAISFYNRQDLTTARHLLKDARASFATTGSPFLQLSEFFLAVSGYYEDTHQTHAALLDLLGRTPADFWPTLAGRIEWRLGIIEAVQGAKGSALRWYSRGTQHLAMASGHEEEAFGKVLMAEVYDELGQLGLGWDLRIQALSVLSYSGDFRRETSMLNEAAQALLRQGQAELAEAFLAELVGCADEWGLPASRALAFRQRARNAIELEDLSSARLDLEQASEAVDAMPDSSFRRSLSISLDFASAVTALEESPSQALERMTVAYKEQHASGFDVHRIYYHAKQAEGYHLLGDAGREREQLLALVDVYEELRCSVDAREHRAGALLRAQKSLDRLIALALDLGDRDLAFTVADRSRARLLIDSLTKNCSKLPGIADRPHEFVAALAAHLDAATLVQYSVLPDQLLIWRYSAGKQYVTRVAASRSQLESLVETLLHDIDRGAPTEIVQHSASILYRLLISPLELPEGIPQVLIIPDQFLTHLPFSALYDEINRQYLIEQQVLTVLPSATMLLFGGSRGPGAQHRAGALIVGDPELSHAGHWELPSLTEAVTEAREIARLYPEHELLLRSEADRTRFLEGLERNGVLHFAGHALANDHALDRSFLFLAPPVDRGTGEVEAGDILQRDLHHVDLVVLSACRTMRGLSSGREGLLGLAEVFLAAGVQTVVASLWDVDDHATRELMVRFHRHWQDGASAAEALRLAMLERINRSPADWAGFVVISRSNSRRTQ